MPSVHLVYGTSERRFFIAPLNQNKEMRYPVTQPIPSAAIYAFVFVAWLVGSVTFTLIAKSLGSKFRAENDGCLLSIGVQVTVLVGGAAGLLAFPYPYNIVASMVGALAFPGLLCGFFYASLARSKK